MKGEKRAGGRVFVAWAPCSSSSPVPPAASWKRATSARAPPSMLAAAATRALLKGAKWVETNPKAAAILAVEKKYLASTPELNTVALARLRYIPSVQLAEESVHTAAREMKVAKMLAPETDTEALAKRAFMHLDGVSDDWIRNLAVETVAGGQISPAEDARLLASLAGKDLESSCCRRKMFDQPDQEAPNLADPEAPCLSRKLVADQPHQ